MNRTIARQYISTLREHRRLLLAMALPRVQAGSGSGETFLAERRTVVVEWPDLRQILAPVSWAIADGVATRAYMPERATQDLDILVQEQWFESALDALVAAGYVDEGALSIPGHMLRSPTAVEIDLLWSDAPWVTPALAQPQTDPAGYPVLARYSPADKDDLESLIFLGQQERGASV